MTTSPSKSIRRSHRSSSHYRRRILYAAAIIAAIFALAAALWKAEPAVERATAERHDAPAPSIQPAAAARVSHTRSIFRHSVVPGGVYSDGELRAAMRHDPVVAAHYKMLGHSPLRSEVVPHDRLVYVSYRKGNDIYWTAKKVLLRAGETILTDGTTQIRARCGNCISETALTPTADVEPEVVEFDELAPPAEDEGIPAEPETPAEPVGGGAPGLIAAGPAGQPVAPSGAAPFAFPAAAPAPFVRWGGMEPRGAPTEPAPPAQPESTGDGRQPSPPGDNNPPSDNPPSGDNPPAVDNPPADNPPADNPPPADDPPVETIPPDDTPLDPGLNPVPVPEPSTYLLVGGGVAALLRRLRSRNKKRSSTQVDG